jgi:peptidoglycan-associated lipoprotein
MECMKRICLLAAIAALWGCGGHRLDLTPVTAADSSTPHYTPVTAPPPRPAGSDPSSLPHDSVDSSAQNADDGASGGVPPRRSESEAISTVNGQLEDVFFPYDHFDLAPDASAALRHDAELLRTILHDFPGLQITVEGHCDDRGSAEYNLGLGDRRATRAVASLSQLGLPAANFAPVSYGKERPQCTESNERCWSQNRRAHFVVRTPPTE